MSGSGKTGLIVHVGRFDFSPITQINYQILLLKSARLEWSVFADYFPKYSGDTYEQSRSLMELWPAWG